jgi:pimeloyl-[acyl-carrier protein] methyl ester esterase
MVATNWAQRFPKEISGLVIINPSFKGLSPWYCRIRPGAIPSILRAVFEPDLVKSETDVLSQVSNAPALYSKTSAQWAEIRKSRPVSRLNFFRQAVAASLAKVSSKKGMQVPSLILSSENDRLVNSPRCSKDAALALNAGLKFHPTAGHDLPLDDPEWIIVQLRGWLERLN